MLETLRNEVLEANLRLVRVGLTVLAWGSASARDLGTGLVVVCPGGIDHARLQMEDLVVVSPDGAIVEGARQPASDTPTHLELYRAFPEVGGVVHACGVEATARAQSRREIPCYGTVHADCFHGSVPLARLLTPQEVEGDYERNIGRVIVECLGDRDPRAIPGALVAGHGPWTWGGDVRHAVDNAVALEAIAHMARLTEENITNINPCFGRGDNELPLHVSEKQFRRR